MNKLNIKLLVFNLEEEEVETGAVTKTKIYKKNDEFGQLISFSSGCKFFILKTNSHTENIHIE